MVKFHAPSPLHTTALQEGFHPVCLEDFRIAGPGAPMFAALSHTPLSLASPSFPSWNGSAVVVILPALIPLCGEVILFYHRLQTSE